MRLIMSRKGAWLLSAAVSGAAVSGCGGATAKLLGRGGDDARPARDAAAGDERPEPEQPRPEPGPVAVPAPQPGDFDPAQFAPTRERLIAEKDAFAARQKELLEARYDLADRSAPGITMSRGKTVQAGVRVKLAEGQSFADLAALSPAEIRARKAFPGGFMPLPHPKQEEGGMVFPQVQIDELKAQEGRDLTRFDLDFDLPDHFMPEFPPAMFLTTRKDLGDVSQGKLVTNQNFYDLFAGILNPKQLDGLRLLTTPFAQQQFNLTPDRRSDEPHQGVACLDCHANGGSNGATHLIGDIRPQELRRRIDTPALRGLNIQRLFGSQRALKTVEDFTEFEQRAAYFDGDPVAALKKGVNFLDRGHEVQAMAELQELFDFPPAPKLGFDGKLDPMQATAQEERGQEIFFGKGQCATCHTPPYYTDNTMHDLRAERFYTAITVNGRKAGMDGPIKTFVLRGIKETPPYLHDGRLLTLDDTVEYFNLILGLKLAPAEKADLVSFLYTL